jgi:hypothetical protein
MIAPGIVAQSALTPISPLAATHLAVTRLGARLPRSSGARRLQRHGSRFNYGGQVEQAGSQPEQRHALAIIDCHLQLAMVTPVIAGFMARVVEEATRGT